MYVSISLIVLRVLYWIAKWGKIQKLEDVIVSHYSRAPPRNEIGLCLFQLSTGCLFDHLCASIINASIPAPLAKTFQTIFTYLHRLYKSGRSQDDQAHRLLMKRAFSGRPGL